MSEKRDLCLPPDDPTKISEHIDFPDMATNGRGEDDYTRAIEEQNALLADAVKSLQKDRRRAAADEEDPAHWDVTPWDEPVQTGELLEAMGAIVERYMVLPKHAAIAIALWILHAWTYAAWMISPLMIIVSPIKQCGKSTLLTILFWFLPRSEITANASASPIFRSIQAAKPHINTFLFDEADSYFKPEAEDLRGILNSSWMRMTANVLRTEGDGNNRKARRFSVWAPKIIATIKAVADTLMDRAVIIKLRRATREEKRKVKRFLMQDTDEFVDLRRKCLRWANDNTEALRNADPELPDELANRPADNWRPLIAIANLAGDEWTKKARKAALALSGFISKQDPGVLLLQDTRRVFMNDGGQPFGDLGAEVLRNHLVDLPESPWAEWRNGDKAISSRGVSKLLEEFDIASRKSRDFNRYHREDFEKVWDSYLPPYEPPQPEKDP